MACPADAPHLQKYYREGERKMKKSYLMYFGVLIFSLLLLSVGCSSDKPATKSEKFSLEGYPDKTINMLVGYAAGGGSDINARTLIKALSNNGIINQSMQVENLPGASGVHAFNKLYKESGNIYQLLIVPEMGIPLVNGSLDLFYDDFQPIAQVATGTTAIFVSSGSKYQTIEQVLEAIKNNPQSISIAVPGALDSIEPFYWYSILEKISWKSAELGSLNIIPTDGESAVITNVIGGHTDVALLNASSNLADQAESGNARVLALLSPERLAEFPDVPTLKEKGIDIVHSKARGLWMGKDVPREMIEFWEEKLQEVMKTPEWEDYLKQNMLQPTYLKSEEYTNYLQQEGTGFKEYILKIKESR
ncbi:MAG: tripartite tricarboxylate transporter substrate binding protein [Eubacteriaceae bacterium]